MAQRDEIAMYASYQSSCLAPPASNSYVFPHQKHNMYACMLASLLISLIEQALGICNKTKNKKLAGRVMEVAVLEGDFIALCNLGLRPFRSVSYQLQEKGLKLPDALWTSYKIISQWIFCQPLLAAQQPWWKWKYKEEEETKKES